MARSSTYLKEFFSLRAAGKILNISGPITNGDKEITEAMAIRKRLRPILLESPMNLSVIDICSGNGLVPLLSTFTLPSKMNLAIDKKKRKGDWKGADRFNYLEVDIYNKEIIDIVNQHSPCIITACHACKNLSKRIIEIFQKSKAEQIILMPCCVGNLNKIPEEYRFKGNSYDLWDFHLASYLQGSIESDQEILSPRNRIITARKNESGVSKK